MVDADKLVAPLSTAEEAVARDVSAALQVAGEIVQVEAQISITRDSISGKGHVPSAPGQPPNQDTGTLANGIVVTQPEPLRVDITATAPYSTDLELGTSKMAPRPFMAPAVAATRREVIETVIAATRASIRRHFGKL